MRFITGLALGGAIGYVLGAKAGREQYERIVALTESALQSDPLNQMVDIDKLKELLGNGMASASQVLRDAAG